MASCDREMTLRPYRKTPLPSATAIRVSASFCNKIDFAGERHSTGVGRVLRFRQRMRMTRDGSTLQEARIVWRCAVDGFRFAPPILRNDETVGRLYKCETIMYSHSVHIEQPTP